MVKPAAFASRAKPYIVPPTRHAPGFVPERASTRLSGYHGSVTCARRVLLVEPPFYRLYKDGYGLARYPLSLGYLAAALRTATQSSVLVVNGDFHPDPEPFSAPYLTGEGFVRYCESLDDPKGPEWGRLGRTISRFVPDVIGITVRTPTLGSALAVARLAREIRPEAVIVAGGPHATIIGDAMLDHPPIDVVAVGEAETTLVELVETLDRGGSPEDVPGLIFREGRRALRTRPRHPLEDLDGLPHPHRFASEVLDEFDRHPVSAFGHILATRGCPHACGFCSSPTLYGRKVRARSPDDVIFEVSSLQGMGVNHVHFEDDTFGIDEKHLCGLSSLLASKCRGITWSCETHVNRISPESLVAMKQGGCTAIQLGIESGDDRVLSRIGKGFTYERAHRASLAIKAAGLRLEAFFMVGCPEETVESLAATRRAIEQSPADKIIYSIFTPYPGTPMFDSCRKLGLVGPHHDFSRHNHQSPENHFSPHIDYRQFRELAADIERLVSDKNGAARRREVLGCRTPQ